MLIGKRIYGRYKIIAMVGGGGMANVYLAEDMILEREVAIKILRMDFSTDDEFIKRFNREAQSATSLDHPNIVSIYDVGEEDNIYFIVMEYVKGLTLKQYIQQNSAIPVEKAIHIMEQIISAISHAHHHGIIHRDIKPQNILIDEQGTVKITDFGIATALSATSITQTNAVLGSVHYLSPEQARGGMANKKSDIYSLGIVMFELLTGRLPFSGESAVSIALKHLQSTTPSLRRWNPSIPQSVENIVLKATAKDPFHRYSSADEMMEDLGTALSPSRINEKPFIVPLDMDATKAMPIITKDIKVPESGDTIIMEEDNEPEEYDDSEDIKPAKKQPKTKKTKKAKKTKKKKDKKPRGKLVKVLLWLFAIVILLGILAITVLPNILGPDDVKVPDLEGKEMDEAISILLENGLELGETIDMSDEEIEENKVIKTKPAIGRTVKEGQAIDLYISTGKERIEVSDYTGRQYEDIKSLIADRYKDIVAEETYSDEYPAGTIISQDPEPGAEVIPSETVMNLVVSKGSDLITVKNLYKYSQSALDAYEEETGLNISIKREDYSDEVDKGLVISQDPSAGTRVKKGSTIYVTISKGKEELPPKVVIREVTIPYEGTDGEEQTVQIYLDDMNHSMTEPVESIVITESIKKRIELTIAPGQKAAYRVISNDRVLNNEVIPYAE